MSLLLLFQLLLWCAILWLLQSTEHGTTIGDSLDEEIFHNSFSTPDLLPIRNVELEQRLNDITSSTFQDRLSFPQSMPSSPSMNEPIINVNKNSMSFLTSIQIEFSDGMYSPLDSEEAKQSVCRSEIRSLALRDGNCIYISTSSRYRFLKGARGHQTHSGDRESDHSVSITQIQHSPSVFYSLTSINVSLKSYPEYRGNASALFHYLSTKLSSAVSSGNFTSHLRAISSELNSSSTMAATCLSCSTFNFSVETHGNLATSPSTSPFSSGLPTLSPSAVVYQPPKCSPVESAPSGSPQNEGQPTAAPSLVAPPPPPPSSPSSSSRTQPDLLVPITAGAALLCLGVICAIVYSRGMSRCGVCSGKIHSEGCSTDNGKQLPDRSLVYAGRAMSSPLPQLQELHQLNSSRPSPARPDPAATFSTMEESSEEDMREQLQRLLSRMNLLEKENATLRVRVTRLEQNLPGAAAAAYSSPLPPPPNPFRRPGSNNVLNGGGCESHSQSEAEREQREPGDVQPTGASIFAPGPALSQLSPLLPPPNPFRRPGSNDVWNGCDFESRSQSEAEREQREPEDAQRTTSVTASIFAPGPALSQLGTPPRPLVLTPRERRSPPRPCATPPPTPPLTPPTERSGKPVFGLAGQTRTPGIGIPVSLPTPPPSPRRLALSLSGEEGALNMNYDDLAFGSHFDGKGSSLQKHCEYSWQHSLSMSNSPLASSSRETMGDR